MISVDIRKFASVFACCASGPVIALLVAGAATADPGTPVVPPPAPAPAPGPAPAGPAVQAAPADRAGQLAAQPPAETPHLASPDALPPGATMDPAGQGTESPNLSYLKDLWHAVQNQEISGKEAFLLGIAQRNMNTPIPEQAPGPNVPVAPGAPAPGGVPGPNPLAPNTPMPPGAPLAPAAAPAAPVVPNGPVPPAPLP